MPVMDIERPLVATGPHQGCGPAPESRRYPAPPPRSPEAETRHHRRAWQPLSGDALLQRLRVTGRPRPEACPETARMLRTVLASGLEPGGSAGAGPGSVAGSADGPRLPVLVTKDRLTRVLACETHRVPDTVGARTFSLPLACGSLIDVLFRQLVTVGSIGDPMEDGLAALAIDDYQSDLRAWIDQLAGAERDELRSEVERQADGLRRRWPSLDPTWLPRTQENVRVPCAGGAVELSARLDLVIGRPASNEGSVAIVEVKSGSRRVDHRADLHFYALLEALRSPAPPFAVATYYSRTGELDVDPVTDELLVGAARRTAAGIRRLVDLAQGAEPRNAASPLCGGCSILPEAVMGSWTSDGRGDDHVAVGGR